MNRTNLEKIQKFFTGEYISEVQNIEGLPVVATVIEVNKTISFFFNIGVSLILSSSI